MHLTSGLSETLHRFARGAHVLVTIVFLVMAAIQLNDPDPVYWFVVYAVVAAVPAGRAFGCQLSVTLAVAGGMVLAGLLISGPGFVDYLASGDYAAIGGKMAGGQTYVESAREFLGLLIAGVCLAVYKLKLKGSEPFKKRFFRE